MIKSDLSQRYKDCLVLKNWLINWRGENRRLLSMDIEWAFNKIRYSCDLKKIKILANWDYKGT